MICVVQNDFYVREDTSKKLESATGSVAKHTCVHFSLISRS